MAGKTATIFIIDVGASMGDCHNGRDVTDFDYGMHYVWDKMATIMSDGRQGDNVGVIGLRTEITDNPLSETDDSGSYDHVCVLKELGKLEMEDLKRLRGAVAPSKTDDGDAISAIVVATHIMEKFTTLKTGKQGKFVRKIILLTDGQGEADGEDIVSIAEQLNQLEIALTVIGIDFDSEDPEFIEEDKTSVKRQNEAYLKALTEKCKDSILGTATEAIAGISIPKVKEVRPVKSYEGPLQLGDFEKYPESAVKIDIVRYPKTKIAKPVSASQFVVRTDKGVSDSRANLSSVKNSVTYQVQDTSNGGLEWIDVERDELARGYLYGRTIVPFGEDDEAVRNIPSQKSFTIIGFIPSDKYEKLFNMGESSISFAPTSSNESRLAFSSFVRALHETESYAVARLVLKDGKDPQVVIMAPLIDLDMEALIDVPLPFQEDVRIYHFLPLDRVITTKGEVLTQHRNLPSDALVDAMSNYVDSMDLSAFGEDDEGNPAEYMPFEETFAPTIHRINQAIRQRAIYPDGGLADTAPILTKWEKPPQELVSRSAEHLEKLVATAAVKKVDEKKRGKRGREAIKPKSNLDIDDLLKSERKPGKISADNAIPEFKQMITNASSEVIQEAIRQLGVISCSVISSTSASGAGYDIALANIHQMRSKAIDLEEAESYNLFIVGLKKKLTEPNFIREGDEREFWLKIKRNNFGLIRKSENPFSEITEDEAQEFLKLPTSLAIRGREN